MSRKNRRKRRRSKRRKAFRSIGRRIKKSAKRLGRSRIVRTAATAALGGAAATLAARAIRGRGGRRGAGSRTSTSSFLPQMGGFNPALSLSSGGTRNVPAQNSNQQVASDILAQGQQFLAWLQSRGELAAIPLLVQFIASGGASLPGQIAGLWGQFLADQANSGATGSGTLPVPISGGGGGGTLPVSGGGTMGLYNELFMPVAMSPTPKIINSAPRGYVIITNPISGQKMAVRKEIARKLRLWKPRPKPPITASQYRTLKTAQRVESKLKRLTQGAGYVVRPKKTA